MILNIKPRIYILNAPEKEETAWVGFTPSPCYEYMFIILVWRRNFLKKVFTYTFTIVVLDAYPIYYLRSFEKRERERELKLMFLNAEET